MSENNANYGAPLKARKAFTLEDYLVRPTVPDQWESIAKSPERTKEWLKSLLEGKFCDDLVFELLLMAKARACHEANKLWCEKNGDNSQVSWEQASEDVKLSALKGVLFALTNPTLTPEDQHNAWMKDKVEAGWIYGSEKNPEAKTHPCIVPYNELPAFQKFKDEIFRAIAVSYQDKT